jgi:hypothetical protein
VQSQGFVDLEHQCMWDNAQAITHPFDGDGSDLLGLGLGIAI